MYPEKKDILNKNFIYIYLIFDLDPHHSKKIDSRNINSIVNDNLMKNN